MAETEVSEAIRETDEFREVERLNAELSENALLFQERLAELELYLDDQTWTRLYSEGEREFSREGLKRIRKMSRFAFLKSPLINHAVRIQANYVWGQGMNVVAEDEDVQDCVDDFLNHKANERVLTSDKAARHAEIETQVEGDLFIGLTPNKSNGTVRATRYIPDEFVDIITNPDDLYEPWFYKRQWTPHTFNPATGAIETGEPQVVYYPDWQYEYNNEHTLPADIDGKDVDTSTVIYHVKVGGFSDMRFGVPEIYNALDWAMAVKANLEDFASITRALARFAWNLKVKGGKAGVAAGKQKLGTTLSGPGGAYETNPPPVAGSTFISPADGGYSMEPMKTAGVAPSPEESNRMWLMVSAGTGIPLPMLSGDAEAGSYATASTLDRPTELQMRERQQLWANVYQDILSYVIDRSIDAPSGKLKGTKTIDGATGDITYELDGDTDRTVKVSFPNILKRDTLQTVQAVVQAATLNGNSSAGTIDDRTLAKLLLEALEMEDIDEIIEELFPGDEVTTDVGKSQFELTMQDNPAQPGGGTGTQFVPQTSVGGNQPPNVPSPSKPQKPVGQTKKESEPVKVRQLREARSAMFEAMAAPLSRAITAGAKDLRDGKIKPATFVRGAKTLMTKHYADAFARGGTSHDENYEPGSKGQDRIASRVERQTPFLQNWADQLTGKKQEAEDNSNNPDEDVVYALTDEGIADRADMYAGGVQPAFFEGMTDAAGANGTPVFLQWDGGDCDLCSARDGVIYAEDDLPGYPGDGGFGELCEGGPECNCQLEVVDDSEVTEASRNTFINLLRKWGRGLRMVEADKVSKSSVNYRQATGTQECGNCSMFSNGSCSLVAGKISPQAVCDRWDRKEN